MKRVISILITTLFMLTLASCSAQDNTTFSETEEKTTTVQKTTKKAENKSENKILTVYFSAGNSSNADAVSSATPKLGDKYVTEYIATQINDKVGGDIEPVVPEEDYPKDYNDTADKAKDENEKNARPKFTLKTNPEDYDVIFIGYPIWWYEMPMIMDTFFDEYDFSEKTIIPFNTHEGSGDGGTYDDIKKLEPKANVLDGFNIQGSSGKSEIDSGVKDWLNGLKF